MSKPTDPGDSTQPLSESQVVAVTPKPPQPAIPPGDQSVAWKGTVVSADDFAPAPVKRPSRAKWAVIGVLGAGAVGAGAYALWPSSSSKPPAAAGSATSEGSGSGGGSAVPASAPIAIDAAPPPPPDAAAPADAAAPPDAAQPAAPAKKPGLKKKPTFGKKKPH
jgi:hypothetical protein